MFKNEQEKQNNCRGAHVGNKLMFLAIGGTIGAIVALLFAPKPGKEMRRDIANAAVEGYDETIDAAIRTTERTAEYLNAAKQKGADLIEAVVEKVSDAEHKFIAEASEFGTIVEDGAKRAVDAVRSRQVL